MSGRAPGDLVGRLRVSMLCVLVPVSLLYVRWRCVLSGGAPGDRGRGCTGRSGREMQGIKAVWGGSRISVIRAVEVSPLCWSTGRPGEGALEERGEGRGISVSRSMGQVRD